MCVGARARACGLADDCQASFSGVCVCVPVCACQALLLVCVWRPLPHRRGDTRAEEYRISCKCVCVFCLRARVVLRTFVRPASLVCVCVPVCACQALLLVCVWRPLPRRRGDNRAEEYRISCKCVCVFCLQVSLLVCVHVLSLSLPLWGGLAEGWIRSLSCLSVCVYVYVWKACYSCALPCCVRGSFFLRTNMTMLYICVYMYMYTYNCVCVCVCIDR